MNLKNTLSVGFTQQSQLHPITQPLLPLWPFNTEAPYLHTVSVFHHGELNSLRKILYIVPFFGIIDCTFYRGQNYHTNSIVIVYLATLFPLVACMLWNGSAAGYTACVSETLRTWRLQVWHCIIWRLIDKVKWNMFWCQNEVFILKINWMF